VATLILGLARPHVELAHADEIEPVPLPAAGWPAGATIRLLSTDTETRALSGLLSLPAGWRRGPGSLHDEHERHDDETDQRDLRCARQI